MQSRPVSKTKVFSSSDPELGQGVTLQLQFCRCRIIFYFFTADFKKKHLLATKSFGWLVWFILTQANYSVHFNISKKENLIHKYEEMSKYIIFSFANMKDSEKYLTARENSKSKWN